MAKTKWNWYTPMTEVLKPGKVGEAEITHYSPSSLERTLGAIHGERDPGERFAQLRVRGGLIMSDTTDEHDSNYEAVSRAHGNVLIGGLGLGMVLVPILANPEVEQVEVLELEPDVIALVAGQLVGVTGFDKLILYQADVFTWRRVKGQTYNTIYMDIWSDICTDSLPEIAKLKRKYAQYLDRSDPKRWIGAWQESRLRSIKRRDRGRYW